MDKICVSTKHKLGFDIDCFNMSNHKFDTGRSKQDKELRFFTVDSKLVDEKRHKYRWNPKYLSLIR